MPLITAAQLARVAPHAAAHIVAAIVDHADDVLPRYGLATAARLPDFLAHVLVESAYLTRLSENLDYTAARLVQVWPTRFKTIAAATPYAHQPEKLADFVYGGRMGNTGLHDGWLNRGQGLLEETGHDNLQALALHMRVGLEAARTALTSDAGMLEAAAAVYVMLGAPAYADRGDIVGTTRCVNGGTNGLADRRAALALCRKVWPRVPMPAIAPIAAPKSAPARPIAPAIPPQTKEATVPKSRMPVFVTALLGLFGVSAAQAAPIGPSAVANPLLFWSMMLGFVLAFTIYRMLPRLRLGQALKLAAVLLLAGVGAAHAGTVDFSPLAQAAVNDLVAPVLLTVAPTVAAILVLPLKRYLDQKSASDMTGRMNDLLDKAIAFGAKAVDKKLAAGPLDIEVDGFVAETAAAYANSHAPQLMQRAAGATGPALNKLLQEKVEARLDSHADVLALKGKIASRAVGAPLQLAGAAA
ncbi:MAG: glycoside hydrolase family 19 protein [Janthinobacterium lividum]